MVAIIVYRDFLRYLKIQSSMVILPHHWESHTYIAARLQLVKAICDSPQVLPIICITRYPAHTDNSGVGAEIPQLQHAACRPLNMEKISVQKVLCEASTLCRSCAIQ